MTIDDALGIFDIGGNLFKAGYNIWANKRDFDYQKNLQQQIFQREDTAVQRRMNDLKSAGLNPNLAAGSAAAAGSVVSRSNTNDIQLGSLLDAQNAVQQIKGQKLQNKIAMQEKESNDIDLDLKRYQTAYSKFKILADMGIPTAPYFENGKFYLLTPDDQYVDPSKTNYFKKLNADAFKYDNVVNDYLREGYKLMNEQQKVAADIVLGTSNISTMTFQNTLDLMQFLVKKDIDYKQLDLAFDRLGLDKTKIYSDQFMKALPYLIMLLGGL